MKQLFAIFALLISVMVSSAARADDISATSRGVVRVVTVAIVNGEIVDFGHGSGFAVSPTRIVTNAHVVESAVRYPQNVALGVVPSQGEKSYEARLIAIDTERDLALLELVEGRVPPTTIYTGAFAEGAQVVALGYPGNVDAATAVDAAAYITPSSPVRSSGNFSNLRPVNGVSQLVHTADIARGNSGGPLVDLCGRVIGVNTLISRADNGDDSFGFAIAARELVAFLKESKQAFSGVANECVTLDQASERERARLAASQREAEEVAEDRQRDRQQRLDAARADLAASRENRMALALVLFVVGALALGAAGLIAGKRPARDVKIAIGLGAVLIVVAAVLFFTRPSLSDVSLDPVPGETPKPGDLPATQASLSCRLIPERSRITVSSIDSVDIDFSGKGCVNGKTQYVLGADGRWTRILVPAEEDTVSAMAYDPASRTFTTERYLLDAETMGRARTARGADSGAGQCLVDPDALEALASKQQAIDSILPDTPNERLVFDCGESR